MHPGSSLRSRELQARELGASSVATITNSRGGKPMDFTRQGLSDTGFSGFFTIAKLRRGRLREVPTGPGVYIVLREAVERPAFLDTSIGGWFNGDPTVPRVKLQEKWVLGTPVIYIGKSDGKKGLQRRLKDFLNFGAGQPVGHWGGRYTWQVENSEQFVIAWKLTRSGQTGRDMEVEFFNEFEQAYGRLPFANINH